MNILKNTKLGPIIGNEFEDYNEFLGIKYANAKRFEYPSICSAWEGEYDATKFGPCCFQRRAFEDDAVCNRFYHVEFRLEQEFKYSEDCQYLNIYAPKNADNCPVLVYIHGGSFTGGSADEGHISGKEYAKRGIVFVSLNYRINVFGFIAHDSMVKDGYCGNFGLADQEAALIWIKNNIDQFGGDANNIILMGQSAGAMSVDLLLSDPHLDGTIKAAIMMSGAGIQRLVAKPQEISKASEFTNAIMQHACVGSVEELKDLSAEDLFYAWSDACKDNPLFALSTLPVRDGRMVTKVLFDKQHIPSIPIILGITATDMMPIALCKVTQNYAKYAEKCRSHCYVYSFDRLLPGDKSGAWHSCDLLYAFGTLGKNWRPFDEIDYNISQKMIDCFVAFVKTKNPNCSSIPPWACGADSSLHLASNISTGPLNKKAFLKATVSGNGASF